MEPLAIAFKEAGRANVVPVKVAEWSPSDLQADWSPKSWDVSKGITGAGEYCFELQYTRGTHRLDFRNVALLDASGTVLGKDDQPGHTGVSASHNVYRFKIANHSPGAQYVLRAEIKGDGGTDSYGDISVAKE